MKSLGSWELPQRPSTTRSLRHSTSWQRFVPKANLAVDPPQPDRYGDNEKGRKPSRYGMPAPRETVSRASTVPVNITTGPWLPTPASICWIRVTPHENIQFLASCLHYESSWTAMRICSVSPGLFREMTSAFGASGRHRLRSSPSSSASSLRT